MTESRNLAILVFCTVSTGVDAIAEVVRRGFSIAGIIGVHPEVADPVSISGYIDVAVFATEMGIPFHYVRSYTLKDEADRRLLKELDFDLVWISGWQRLVPQWLIEESRLGVLGGHGSPDGIHGGRGRSPQNWAILLGCERFDLALFKITPGIDEGPVIAQRSYFYHEQDDIRVSYYRASLAMADMVCEVLRSPEVLLTGTPQPTDAHYYPQRLPEDGHVDWSLTRRWIARHCRALTTPYPGLKSRQGGVEISLWECQSFDDAIDGEVGLIGACFYSGEFLVNCKDGRVLVRKWSADNEDWRPRTGLILDSVPFSKQLAVITERHEKKYPKQMISSRIKRWSD